MLTGLTDVEVSRNERRLEAGAPECRHHSIVAVGGALNRIVDVHPLLKFASENVDAPAVAAKQMMIAARKNDFMEPPLFM